MRLGVSFTWNHAKRGRPSVQNLDEFQSVQSIIFDRHDVNTFNVEISVRRRRGCIDAS